jgi:hypothetical protein
MTPMNGLGISTAKFTSLEAITNSYSIDLDGTDDCVNLGNSSEIKLRPTDTSEGGGITASAWFKNDAWDGTSSGYPASIENIISCIQIGGWGIAYQHKIAAYLNIVDPDDASKSLYLGINGQYKTLHDGAQSYRASGWFHVAMTFDGRTFELYVNGRIETSRSLEAVDSTADDTPIRYATGQNDTDVIIGGDPNNLTSPDGGLTFTSGSAPVAANFNGKIDQVAIWNKALDIEAVKEIFDAVDVDGEPLELTEDSGDYDYSDSLVGYWKLEEGTGTTASDSSDNSNTGTLQNSPTWSTTTPS